MSSATKKEYELRKRDISRFCRIAPKLTNEGHFGANFTYLTKLHFGQLASNDPLVRLRCFQNSTRLSSISTASFATCSQLHRRPIAPRQVNLPHPSICSKTWGLFFSSIRSDVSIVSSCQLYPRPPLIIPDKFSAPEGARQAALQK